MDNRTLERKRFVMGRTSWIGKRTLDHCSLITKMGGAPRQYDGKCEGFQKGDDDEPCEICKKCKLNTAYEGQQNPVNGKVMAEKCKKCGSTDLKVWQSCEPGECFLECRKCHWMSKNRKWTKTLKAKWDSQQTK